MKTSDHFISKVIPNLVEIFPEFKGYEILLYECDFKRVFAPISRKLNAFSQKFFDGLLIRESDVPVKTIETQ